MNTNCGCNHGQGVVAPCYEPKSKCAPTCPKGVIKLVVYPPQMGTDAKGQPYAPQLGAYTDTVVRYQANGAVYIYASDGTYTPLSTTEGLVHSINGEVGDVQLGTLTLQINGDTLTTYDGSNDAQFDVHVPILGVVEEDNEGYVTGAMVFNLNQELSELIAKNVEALQTNINLEVMARESDRDNLQININKNANDIALTQTKVAEVEGTVNTLSAEQVQTDTEVSTDESTIILTKTQKTLGADESIDTEMALPVASETEAGVMNAATYNAVQENADNINSILVGAVALDNIAENPTQDDLTEAWKTATGKTDLVNRASIYDTAHKLLWYYYTNTNTWYSSGVDPSSIVTVNQATNDALGIVKGSTALGQSAVEADGTLSLNGFDDHETRITNNATAIETLQQDMETESTRTKNLPAQVVYNSSLTDYTADSVAPTMLAKDLHTNGDATIPMTINAATSTTAGVMAGADKAKLDGLADIQTIGENLTLAEDGTLSATGGGSSVEVSDKMGYSTTDAISQNRFTASFYPDVTSAGLPNRDHLVFPNNTFDNATSENASLAIVGSSNVYNKAADTDKVYSGWVFGSRNTITGNDVMPVVYGSWNTIQTTRSPYVYGYGVKYYDTVDGVVVGAANTLNNTKANGYNSSGFQSFVAGLKVTQSTSGIGIGNSITGRTTSLAVNTVAPDGYTAYDIAIGRAIVSTTGSLTLNEGEGDVGNVYIGSGNSYGFDNVTLGGAARVGDKNTSVRYSGAIGAMSQTNRDYTISFGVDNNTVFFRKNFTRTLANITAGTEDNDAVNLKQMRDYVAANAGGGASETVLYTGTASTNSITLSEAATSFAYIEVSGEATETVGSSTIKAAKVVKVPMSDGVNGFKMEDTDITAGDTPSIVTHTDLWSISEDGTGLALAAAMSATTTSSVNVAQETTSHFVITKVVGVGTAA